MAAAYSCTLFVISLIYGVKRSKNYLQILTIFVKILMHFVHLMFWHIVLCEAFEADTCAYTFNIPAADCEGKWTKLTCIWKPRNNSFHFGSLTNSTHILHVT